MKKSKTYINCRFSAEVIKEAISTLKELAARQDEKLVARTLMVDHDDNSSWNYDTLNEFIADFRKYKEKAVCSFSTKDLMIYICFINRCVMVEVESPIREDIEAVFNVFEKNVESSKLDPSLQLKIESVEPVVFIGHGGNTCWRELKDHLQEKHNVKVAAYETGARAGHSIRDILEEMITKSSFALLVLTGEDKQDDGIYRARQNVIHEAGLLQGRLGFTRAIILLEEGVEEFTNIQGIQYIGFSKDNIREVFGEVIATIRREFQNSG